MISALKNDVSYYNKKVFMVYISGLELENKDTGVKGYFNPFYFQINIIQ